MICGEKEKYEMIQPNITGVSSVFKVSPFFLS
jgi:hypothetical protein